MRVLLLSVALCLPACDWNIPNPIPTPPPEAPPVDCTKLYNDAKVACAAGEPWTAECKAAQGAYLESPCVYTPDPGCVEGQTHSCWSQKPGEMWTYVCPVYDAQGGVIGTTNVFDPATCPTKPVTPDPGQCTFPQSVPEDAFHFVPNTQPTMGDKVNAAIRDVLQGSQDVHGGPQKFFADVNALLRARGLCAGQHADGKSDEIAVQNARGEWEGYHIYSGDDSNTPGTVGKPLLSPNAYRGAWLVDGGTPVPVPTPPPANTFGCSDPFPSRDRWRIDSKLHNPKIVDTTCKVVNQPAYCAKVGMADRATCPVRLEGSSDRVACERYLAEGDWVLEGRNGVVCQSVPGNSAQFRPSDGNCRLCNPTLTVCTTWW